MLLSGQVSVFFPILLRTPLFLRLGSWHMTSILPSLPLSPHSQLFAKSCWFGLLVRPLVLFTASLQCRPLSTLASPKADAFLFFGLPGLCTLKYQSLLLRNTKVIFLRYRPGPLFSYTNFSGFYCLWISSSFGIESPLAFAPAHLSRHIACYCPS